VRYIALERDADAMSESLRVLAVDDDPANVELVAEFLPREDDRLTVETTTSAVDALDRLDRETYDAIISDYQMPEMDGLEFLETVRSVRDSDIPFIIFTGKGREEVAIEALNLGADRYVQKGGNPSSQYGVLADAVRNEIEKCQTERELYQLNQELKATNQELKATNQELKATNQELVAYTEQLEATERQLHDEIEDRKAHERELSRRTRLLEALFEFVPIHLFIKDREGRHLWVSDALYEDPERWVGKRDTEVDGGATDAFAEAAYEEDMRVIEEEERIVNSEDYNAELDRWFLSSKVPWRDGDGNVIGLLGYSFDITERKERERELRVLKERLELAIDAANLGIWDWDMTTDDVQFNDNWATMLGYEPDQIAPRLEEWKGRIHPDDRATVERALDEHVAGEAAYYESEHRIRTADDTWQWVRDVGTVVDRDPDGTPTRAVGIHLDISDRREREAELQKRQEDLRNIIDLVPDLIFAKNREGEYRLANEATAEAYGLSPEKVEGSREAEIIPDPGNAETFRRDDRAVIDSGTPLEIPEETLTTADGETRVLQTTKIPYENTETGEPAVLGYARDITELKRTERDLRRERDRLDEFARSVSHDLRNPLNVAMARTELASEECDSEHLAAVERSLDRMDSLVTDLLALARKGNAVGDVEQVPLEALCAACWSNVKTSTASLVTDDPPTVCADRNRLSTVLENLFRNSVEHGSASGRAEPEDAVERGGAELTVTVGALDDGRGFYVADDGVGIPPDERESVFDSGFSTKTDGTGFGLSIVKQIVEAHGGEISVTESEDGGSRFEITGLGTPEP
jgi:PAS domain S-box-containing protein